MGVPLENLRTLDIIRVNKQELIKQLQNNLEVHKIQYVDAMTGYADETMKLAQEIGALSDDEDRYEQIQELARKIQRLPEPTSHENDYVKAITKLNASVDEEVILSDKEFQQLWMDEWMWKDRFSNAVQNYSSSGR